MGTGSARLFAAPALAAAAITLAIAAASPPATTHDRQAALTTGTEAVTMPVATVSDPSGRAPRPPKPEPRGGRGGGSYPGYVAGTNGSGEQAR